MKMRSKLSWFDSRCWKLNVFLFFRIPSDDNEPIKFVDGNTGIGHDYTITDHSYEASGNDQADINIVITEMEPKKPSRKTPAKPSQFNCQYCELKYTSKKRLEHHMTCHGENIQTGCNDFDMHFSIWSISGSDGTLIFKCQCCPRYFVSVDDMELHKTNQHTDILTCNVCQKRFKDPESLHNHVKYVHEKQKKTKTYQMCPKCGKFHWIRAERCDRMWFDCRFQAKNSPAIMRWPIMRSQTVVDRPTTSVSIVENSITVRVRSNRIDSYTLAKWHSNATHARRNFEIKGKPLSAEPN